MLLEVRHRIIRNEDSQGPLRPYPRIQLLAASPTVSSVAGRTGWANNDFINVILVINALICMFGDTSIMDIYVEREPRRPEKE